MKEPALIHPSIPGVVMKVVPLKKPLTRLNTPFGEDKAPKSVKVAEL